MGCKKHETFKCNCRECWEAEKERKESEVALSDGLCPQTRYRLQYGGHELAFSAPMAETREQLAKVLEEAVDMLKAPEDTGELGFF